PAGARRPGRYIRRECREAGRNLGSTAICGAAPAAPCCPDPVGCLVGCLVPGRPGVTWRCNLKGLDGLTLGLVALSRKGFFGTRSYRERELRKNDTLRRQRSHVRYWLDYAAAGAGYHMA